MRAAYLATWPIRGASYAQGLWRKSWPQLPRPCVSVGNLAFGGRGKTPMTAALAKEAAARGLRSAILTRGYQGQVHRGSSPVILRSVSAEGPPWKRLLCNQQKTGPATTFSRECGDEAAWLAACCIDAVVGVHPNRSLSAQAILAHGEVDIFLLDDGFQTHVQRDLDLVLLDPRRDPPFAHDAACREGAVALDRAHQLALIADQQALDSTAKDRWPTLRRQPHALRCFHSGEMVLPEQCPPVLVAAAVADPSSVVSGARELGLTVLRQLALRDHCGPSRIQRARIAGLTRTALLITEKDALGWAGRADFLPSQTFVLSMNLAGSSDLAVAMLTRLLGPARRGC